MWVAALWDEAHAAFCVRLVPSPISRRCEKRRPGVRIHAKRVQRFAAAHPCLPATTPMAQYVRATNAMTIPAAPPTEASPPAIHLLLIEDEPHFREGLVRSLRQAGVEVQAFERAGAALHALPAAACQVVLTDLRLPDLDGLDVLAACRALDPELPVVLMTGHGDIDTAVQAIKQGAYDFIEKPFGRDRLLTLLTRAAQQYRLCLDNRTLRSRLVAGSGLADQLWGDSAAMRELRERVLLLAPTPVDVLLSGATGTGKEVVARALHDHSGRAGPFVAVNIAALPETLIESELFGHEAGAFTGAAKARVGAIEHAQRGTLFLDEIEAMPASAQVKLLRVLQERELQRLGSTQTLALDLRVVAASNTALDALLADGRLRSDLYYRLNGVTLKLPRLADRRDDIALLFRRFGEQAATRMQREPVAVAPALREQLLAHDWPGNVRELKSAAERHVLGLPVFETVPDDAAGMRPLLVAMEAIEAQLIDDALRRNHGDVAAASRELDVPPATLYRKLKGYGLKSREYRAPVRS
jgi:DNA-binding NtrC family response regulator